MSKNNMENRELITSNSVQIQTVSDWRIYMRVPATLGAGKIAFEPNRVGELPEAVLASAFLLAKIGDPNGARERLNSLQMMIGSDSSDVASLAGDILLVDAHVKVYEDRALTKEDSAQLAQLLLTLPANDLVGQAMTFNHLSTAALHRGEFDRAQDHAENAIRLYRLGDAQFGSLHMHTHLGQIRMMRGDLTGAIVQYDEMESSFEELTSDPQGLRAICQALKSEVHFEMNEMGVAQSLLDEALKSIEQTDAWLDILAATYRVRARLAFVRAGLPGTLTELAHADAAARDRQMPRLAQLMAVERIRALTLSDEIKTANKEMNRIGIDPSKLDVGQPDKDWGLRHGTTNVAIARWLVRARRPKRALDFVELAEETAIKGGQLLSLAKLRVIRAQAFWQLKARRDATGALLSAIRLLGNQPFRRFILDEGLPLRPAVQAVLDGEYVTVPINTAQRRQLSEIMHYWSLGAEPSEVGCLFNQKSQSTKRYLELLAKGHSNKEIGSVMGVSTNTVKYHLKQIYGDLRVKNRACAVNQARELGIIDA
jgi:ATP/maltotriose-dependent transcriptional regulator MalT